MKKVLVLLILLTMAVISFSKGGKITSQINVGMSREELERAINKTSMSGMNILRGENGDGIYFYEKISDPLGVVRERTSFNFSDNKLVSAIFDDTTTDTQHKAIYDYYVKNKDKLKEKLTVMEDEKHKYLLMYNNKITLVVERAVLPNEPNKTLITVHQSTPETISTRIAMFNEKKESN